MGVLTNDALSNKRSQLAKPSTYKPVPLPLWQGSTKAGMHLLTTSKGSIEHPAPGEPLKPNRQRPISSLSYTRKSGNSSPSSVGTVSSATTPCTWSKRSDQRNIGAFDGSNSRRPKPSRSSGKAAANSSASSRLLNSEILADMYAELERLDEVSSSSSEESDEDHGSVCRSSGKGKQPARLRTGSADLIGAVSNDCDSKETAQTLSANRTKINRSTDVWVKRSAADEHDVVKLQSSVLQDHAKRDDLKPKPTLRVRSKSRPSQLNSTLVKPPSVSVAVNYSVPPRHGGKFDSSAKTRTSKSKKVQPNRTTVGEKSHHWSHSTHLERPQQRPCNASALTRDRCESSSSCSTLDSTLDSVHSIAQRLGKVKPTQRIPGSSVHNVLHSVRMSRHSQIPVRVLGQASFSFKGVICLVPKPSSVCHRAVTQAGCLAIAVPGPSRYAVLDW